MQENRRITDPMSALPTSTANASLATRPATMRQQRFASVIACVLVAITVALVPFATVQWPKFQSFFPCYQTALVITYLVTAYLMFSQYKATSMRGLLTLGAGCLYTAGVLIVQFLAVPGMIVENVQLIGGPQSVTWLWFFWHLGPDVSVLLFAWGEFVHGDARTARHREAFWATLGATALALVATVVLVTTFSNLLPVMDVAGDYTRITRSGLAPAIELLGVIVLILLWRASRFRTVLHVGLGIALVALLCDNAITMLGGSRLSVGWYAGRFGALFASCVMMFVYLEEVRRSYVSTMAESGVLLDANETLTLRMAEAMRDDLTGLPGRAMFMLEGESLRAEAVANGFGFATLFIDLDGFKRINDRLGHDHGDFVLVRAAAALKSTLRESDVAGRLGGDEFVACIVAPPDRVLATATRISERIIEKIGSIGDGVGASIGISISSISMPFALREADEAMYDSKRLGASRSTLYRNKPKLAWSA